MYIIIFLYLYCRVATEGVRRREGLGGCAVVILILFRCIAALKNIKFENAKQSYLTLVKIEDCQERCEPSLLPHRWCRPFSKMLRYIWLKREIFVHISSTKKKVKSQKQSHYNEQSENMNIIRAGRWLPAASQKRSQQERRKWTFLHAQERVFSYSRYHHNFVLPSSSSPSYTVCDIVSP